MSAYIKLKNKIETYPIILSPQKLSNRKNENSNLISKIQWLFKYQLFQIIRIIDI